MNKIKKTHILIAVYAIIIIAELFFYVPYNKIQIFRTKNNVPHTETIGSGYTSMADIEDNNANFQEKAYTSSEGKIVNTSQLAINVSATTIVAVAIYFLLKKNDNVNIDAYMDEIPVLDINSLAFADEETLIKAQQDYAKQLVEYIKRKDNCT